MALTRVTVWIESAGAQSKLGAVRICSGPSGLSFSAARAEIEQDLSDVLPRKWVFLDLDGSDAVEIRPQQETKWIISGNSVVIRAASGDEEPFPDPESFEEVATEDPYLKSKNAPAAGLEWRHEVKKARFKLRREKLKRGDHSEDNFEAATEDDGARVRYGVFCVDCKKLFNTGAKRDILKNFTTSHLNTAAHKKALKRGVPGSEVSEAVESAEDDNKKLVQETMEQVATFCEPLNCSFDLLPGNYSDLSKIQIRCSLDLLPIQLFPKRGSFKHNIEAHVASKAHVAAVNIPETSTSAKGKRKAENKPSGDGGRPTKLAATDSKQRGIMQFFPAGNSRETAESSRCQLLSTLCWGFHLPVHQYKRKKQSLKAFLHDKPGVAWFPEPHTTAVVRVGNVDVRIEGTFRHTNCLRVQGGGFANLMCGNCARVPMLNDFRMRVHRDFRGAVKRGARRRTLSQRLDYLSSTELLAAAKIASFEVRRLEALTIRQRHRIAALSTTSRTLADQCSEDFTRSDIKKFCLNIVNAAKHGHFEGKQALWTFLSDLAQNLNRSGGSKRWSSSTKEMFEAVRILGGAKMQHFISLNFCGPQEATIRRAGRLSVKFRPGIHEQIFQQVAGIYSKYTGAGAATVPVILAEDETRIKTAVRYNAREDLLIGFCGLKENHRCDDGFQVEVGTGETGFTNITTAFEQCQQAHYGRVFIVNPLSQSLPKLVIATQLTCNKFDSCFVRKQWEQLEAVWEKCVASVVGPIVGHASDGDGRRRKLMLQDYTREKASPFKVDWPGWPFSATETTTGAVHGLHDQDFIHNGKKLVNPLDASRNLVLGDYLATFNHIREVFASGDRDQHGLMKTDVDRKDRQNWAAAQRLASRKVQRCMRLLRESDGGRQLSQGTEVYIEIVAGYIDIFLSATKNLASRVRLAARTSFFFRYWRLWLQERRETFKLKENFISQESFLDVQISCHYAVLLVKLFRDRYPGLPVPLSETGSDCCENFFSKIGGMVQHERMYDASDLLDSAGSMNRIAELKTKSELKFSAAHRKQESIWSKVEGLEAGEGQSRAAADLKDFAGIETDAELIEALQKGMVDAQELVSSLGMKLSRKKFQEPWFFEDFYKLQEVQALESRVGDEGDDPEELEPEETGADGDDEELVASLELRHTFDELVDEQVEPATKVKYEPYVEIDSKRVAKTTLVSQLNGNVYLSKDRLKRVRAGVYDTDIKQARTSTSLGYGVDIAVLYDRGWFVGRVLKMSKKTGSSWRETGDFIDLNNIPATPVRLNLHWYRNVRGTGVWTYDVVDHASVSLESVIALVKMSFDPESSTYTLDEADRIVVEDFVKGFRGVRTKT